MGTRLHVNFLFSSPSSCSTWRSSHPWPGTTVRRQPNVVFKWAGFEVRILGGLNHTPASLSPARKTLVADDAQPPSPHANAVEKVVSLAYAATSRDESVPMELWINPVWGWYYLRSLCPFPAIMPKVTRAPPRQQRNNPVSGVMTSESTIRRRGGGRRAT